MKQKISIERREIQTQIIKKSNLCYFKMKQRFRKFLD